MLIRFNHKAYGVLFISLFLAGCFGGATTKPALMICDELDDTDDWIEPAVNVQQKYGTPIALTLAMLELPLTDLDKKHVRPRAADWDEFRIRSERWDAEPTEVEDAVHFVGWFTQQSVSRNGLAWNNAAGHYLAVRLGHGGYHRFDSAKYPELTQQARGIQQRYDRWQRELQGCKNRWQGESWFSKLKIW